MTAKLLDGRNLAARIRKECRTRVDDLTARTGVVPGLAVILVGENPASEVYVGRKIKACAPVGIKSTTIRLPAEISNAELLGRIVELNADPAIHGILVQLPLPD